MLVQGLASAALFVALVAPATALYALSEQYNSSNFAEAFDFQTAGRPLRASTAATDIGQVDPSHGFVEYLDHDTAVLEGVYNQSDRISIRPNARLGPGLRTARNGRPNSVRLESKSTFELGVLVFDLWQVPDRQCGLWSMLMLAGADWPKNGGIKIVEQRGSQYDSTYDRISFHTRPGCEMSGGSARGRQVSTNCDDAATGGQGCAFEYSPLELSLDNAHFLADDGGIFVLTLDVQGIYVHFWARANIPADLLSDRPDPSTWGPPAANFSGPCKVGSYYEKLRIVSGPAHYLLMAGHGRAHI